MKLEGTKDVTMNEQFAEMTFCRTCKTCPILKISVDSDEVSLGSEHEGISIWKKESFRDFVAVVKEGAFDKYLEDDSKNTKG